MEENISLIIKAANQSVVDQKLECSLDCTVKYVKEEICKNHPARPTADEQRLIYSGKLLQDHITLKSVLRHPSENNNYTLHLVCSTPRIPDKASATSASARQISSQPVSQASSNTSASNSSTEAREPVASTDGVRQRFVATNGATESSPLSVQQPAFDPSRVYSLGQFPPTMQGIGDPVQQIAAMQHLYAQYMAFYMQYAQGGSIGSVSTQHEMIHPSTTNSATVASNLVTDAANQQNPAAPIQEPAQNNDQQLPRPNMPLRVNAQGGGGAVADEEEEGGPRDWLDYLYFGCRMLILLFVVYFYSTLIRFVVVILSCSLMYLYQIGWFNAHRREVEPVVAALEPDAPGEDAGVRDPPEEAALERPPVGGSEGESEGQAPSPDNAILEPPQPSIMALSWTFFTSFFTSLIPDQHQFV